MSDWAAKRFWSDVTVDLRGEDYVILLDKRLGQNASQGNPGGAQSSHGRGDCGGVGGAR